jgi:hypothetical protein
MINQKKMLQSEIKIHNNKNNNDKKINTLNLIRSRKVLIFMSIFEICAIRRHRLSLFFLVEHCEDISFIYI